MWFRKCAQLVLLSLVLISVARSESAASETKGESVPVVSNDKSAPGTGKAQQKIVKEKAERSKKAATTKAGKGSVCDYNEQCYSNYCSADYSCACSGDGYKCGYEDDCCEGYTCGDSGYCEPIPTCYDYLETCYDDYECCGNLLCNSGTCKEPETPKPPTTPPTQPPTQSPPGKPSSVPSPDPPSSACFPSDASVRLFDGTMKMMSELKIGDNVLVSGGKYSPVFMFTHKMAEQQYSFLRISTKSGAEITLTDGHYLQVNETMFPSGSVQLGDYLTLADGSSTVVSKIARVNSIGLFNPQTVEGSIVVNGVVASTYTTAVEIKAAHTMLAPLRAAFRWLGVYLTVLESGADYMVNFLPTGQALY